ncbi:hypothetical protein AGDE_02482 [Angomonas deanei]|nr:hypothetical protein AGDE_02482 [Angomonas deanei]|eukprot:EPY41442.1 hypothetical protein AGDE_02482 [Angomonas deanei]
MSRCLQDKMWTTWKCQKERDAYYNCIRDEEQMNTSPTRREEKRLEAASTDNNNTNANKKDDDFVDLITAYRWKYTLGVLNGEIIARNNIMKALWEEHYPDRELPHSWVNGGE